jgi:Fe2+ transport system protein FeoA
MTRSRLVGQSRDRARREAQGGLRTLADLSPGALARVERVVAPGSPATAGRLADLGFTAGTEVQVVRRAPLRDPVLYRVKDYDVCLRRAQAACVRVIEVHR